MRFRPIGPQTSDDDEEKPSLEAVLEHYDVRLRTRPKGYASCPFHPDRTPSLSYDLNEGVWKCHSCGQGGDSYSLLMLKEGVDFGGARSFAADHGFAAGSTGGSGRQLPARTGGFGGGRSLSQSSGSRVGGRQYVPSWRRRGT